MNNTQSQDQAWVVADIITVAQILFWMDPDDTWGGVNVRTARTAFARLVGIPEKRIEDIVMGRY